MTKVQKTDGHPTPQETVELQRTIEGHAKLKVLNEKLMNADPEAFMRMVKKAKDSKGHFICLDCRVFKTEQNYEHCIVLGFTETGKFFTGPCNHAIGNNVHRFQDPQRFFFSELAIAKFIADSEDHNDQGESRILIVQALEQVNDAMEKIIAQLEKDPEGFFDLVFLPIVETTVEG